MATDKVWIEGDALQQLEKTARMEGMVEAVGLPDIHPGKGGPIGAAFLARNVFYPHIIGNDAGCGMSLFQTSIKTKKLKKEKWAESLSGFDRVSDEDVSEDHDMALGTLGGGNHFAELQKVEAVMDNEVFEAMGADLSRLFLLVHSGSRHHGNTLYRNHTDIHGAGHLQYGTPGAEDYIARYSQAIQWASENRAAIAERFMDCIGGRADRLLDTIHNSISFIEKDGHVFGLHRKGAAPSDQGPLVIPGSRGTFSYLVLPTGPQELNLWSLAHGAGRKWNRGSCKGKLKDICSLKSMKQTALGSLVVCDDREAMFEEAPQAYKNIETIIEAMAESGLIRVIATFRPVITCKGDS